MGRQWGSTSRFHDLRLKRRSKGPPRTPLTLPPGRGQVLVRPREALRTAMLCFSPGAVPIPPASSRACSVDLSFSSLPSVRSLPPSQALNPLPTFFLAPVFIGVAKSTEFVPATSRRITAAFPFPSSSSFSVTAHPTPVCFLIIYASRGPPVSPQLVVCMHGTRGRGGTRKVRWTERPAADRSRRFTICRTGEGGEWGVVLSWPQASMTI